MGDVDVFEGLAHGDAGGLLDADGAGVLGADTLVSGGGEEPGMFDSLPGLSLTDLIAEGD